MPLGLAVLKWDDELGPVVTKKTPSDLKIGLDATTSMKVYGIVTLGETEESQKPGFNGLEFGEFNLGVYYGGLNQHLRGLPSMVFLILEKDEDPEIYKDAMTELGTKIFLNADDDTYKKMVPTLYKQISRLTQMTLEQRQASVLGEPIRRAILRHLTDRGTAISTDLEQVVFEDVGKRVDLDMILRPLGKLGLISTSWVEGLDSEVVFLTRAIFILRTIPAETARAVRKGQVPREIAEAFLDEAKEFHSDYAFQIGEEMAKKLWSEAENLADYLLEFESYDIIRILREGPKRIEEIQTRLEIPEKDLKRHLNSLKKKHIVMLKKTMEGEFAFLTTDLSVVTVYPEWLIGKTADLYNEAEITDRQAVHYLQVLKKVHPSNPGGFEMEVG